MVESEAIPVVGRGQQRGGEVVPLAEMGNQGGHQARSWVLFAGECG